MKSDSLRSLLVLAAFVAGTSFAAEPGPAATVAAAADAPAAATPAAAAAEGEMIAGGDGTLKSISVSILNAFTEGIAYLRKNSKSFTDPVLVLTGNNDMCVSPQDAIDFYQETGSTDRSLRIYAGVGHFLMADEKGHMIAPDVLSWILDRADGGTFVDAGI